MSVFVLIGIVAMESPLNAGRAHCANEEKAMAKINIEIKIDFFIQSPSFVKLYNEPTCAVVNKFFNARLKA